MVIPELGGLQAGRNVGIRRMTHTLALGRAQRLGIYLGCPRHWIVGLSKLTSNYPCTLIHFEYPRLPLPPKPEAAFSHPALEDVEWVKWLIRKYSGGWKILSNSMGHWVGRSIWITGCPFRLNNYPIRFNSYSCL
jgi:hypothetical protein